MADSVKRKQTDHNSELESYNTSLSQQVITPFLDQRQQLLLVAALNSGQPHTADSVDSSRNIMNSFDSDFTPDLLDLDDNFDFDNADLGGQMIGGLPYGEDDDAAPEQHEKRKADDEDAEEGDAKRQETTKEGAKKPGRKPLTNEPTTKRKAQNRAAQRAFRERKEAHLKDLETKVSELTKAQEADKHENGLLRAQVDRLQTELRDYRRRLSLNANGAKRSPPLSAQSARNSMGFQFDFPKFGSLPAAQLFDGTTTTASNYNITPPLSTYSPVSTTFSNQPTSQDSRHNSETRSMSPSTQMQQINNTRQSSRMSSVDPAMANGLQSFATADNAQGFAATLPQMGKNANDPFGDLFSPSILKSVSTGANGGYFNQTASAAAALAAAQAPEPTYNGGNGGDSTAGIPDHRVFRFNSQSVASDTASPSVSSLSQGHTANSSCGTSPEPLTDSPATKLKTVETSDNSSVKPAQLTFAGLANQPADLSFPNIDSYSVPQVDSFDPVLFGDYRDTNDSVVGGGDFTGGFFDDSFNSAPPLDWGSPSNLFGILSPSVTSTKTSNAATPSHNLLANVEKARDGGDDDYGLPTTQTQKQQHEIGGKLISCTKIWDQLQSNPDFQDGKFDLDGLCAELRTKARCSESGLVVDSDHVDAAFKKLTNKTPAEAEYGPRLMFEQDSWDNVLKKLKAGGQA